MDLVSGQQLLKITERHSDIMCLLTGGNTAKQEVKPTFDQTSKVHQPIYRKNNRKKHEKRNHGDVISKILTMG